MEQKSQTATATRTVPESWKPELWLPDEKSEITGAGKVFKVLRDGGDGTPVLMINEGAITMQDEVVIKIRAKLTKTVIQLLEANGVSIPDISSIEFENGKIAIREGGIAREITLQKEIK